MFDLSKMDSAHRAAQEAVKPVKKRVLWLSRHPMTEEQKADLCLTMGIDSVKVMQENMTYNENSEIASEEIRRMVANRTTYDDKGYPHKVHALAGVFPAHVAVSLVLNREYLDMPMILLPVSVAVEAAEGQNRGFRHSHWERYL